jgi:hypothetical protein
MPDMILNKDTAMQRICLVIAGILWLIWGLVHTAAGIFTIAGDTTAKVQGIAAGIDPQSLVMDYPAAVGAILNQHGFNLLWFGLVAVVGAWFVTKGNQTAIIAVAFICGLADVGYFVFVDLGGYGTFFPGTLMTIFSASAIVLSLGVLAARRTA